VGAAETPPAAGRRRAARQLATALAVVTALGLSSGACGGDGAEGPSSAEPWGAQTVSAADLAREIAGADRPIVVCTALPSMYRMGHIPGAVLHGPASSPAALGELTSWAQALPRDSSLVIYCGCCPLAYCPNLRPAYNALKGMGFRRLRVLVLPENFGSDWVARGFPVER
jgi:thiosulfate/3-mercaptopyruvate sulfurtransferase